MIETIIVLATASLFVGFGLLRRDARDCPGAHACVPEEAAGCHGCPSAPSEPTDVER